MFMKKLPHLLQNFHLACLLSACFPTTNGQLLWEQDLEATEALPDANLAEVDENETLAKEK